MLWRLHERWNLPPPDIQTIYDENTTWQQALLYTYEQIRQIEEEEFMATLLGGGVAKRMR